MNKLTLAQNMRKQSRLCLSLHTLTSLCHDPYTPYKLHLIYKTLLRRTYKNYIRLSKVIGKQIEQRVRENYKYFKL